LAVVDGTAADVASDKAGEPRGDVPTPPPPGTAVPKFWERDSTKGAVIVTIGLALTVAKSLILGQAVSPDLLAVSVETFVWAWAAAVGLSRGNTDTLKWK